ncbi:MAG: 50S ribosomal protein L9 [Patescibacteria group bacterium]
MQVILLQDVKGRGFKGNVVEVSDGYANNFLFPQALAVPATKDALERLKAQETKTARLAAREEKAAREAAKAMEGAELMVAAKADEKGTLYAAVSAKDVTKAAKAEGVTLKPEYVVFNKPIKQIGTYTLTAEFPGGYEAEYTLTVEAK